MLYDTSSGAAVDRLHELASGSEHERLFSLSTELAPRRKRPRSLRAE